MDFPLCGEAWGMDKMIENSENWNLAGDVALLNSLKQYANNLFKNTAEVNGNLDKLMNNLDELSLKLEIANNEFQSLRNTQFIESRVYEEDETLEKMEEVANKDEIGDAEKNKIISEAIKNGLEIMKKYYDKVEVELSDSEDESEVSYVLKAKDLYADRPLPYVIGSANWHQKWHVGLMETSSESESEKVIDEYSENESEDELPKDQLQAKYSNSSDSDFSHQTELSRPIANSTLHETSKSEIFSGSESETNSAPFQAPISNKSFAEQLAAKLGNVLNEKEPEEVNKQPINKQTGKFLSDEPPPLFEAEEEPAGRGLFSGGTGLFDDEEDDSLWTTKQNIKAKMEDKPTTVPQKSSNVSKGLFDSDDSSEEGIFTSAAKKSEPSYLQPFSTKPPSLISEQPPQIPEPKKKPTGGVALFSGSDLGKNIGSLLKNRKIDSDSDESIKEENPPPLQTVAKPEPSSKIEEKKINLFEDDDDIFKDDLFSTSKKKFTSSLFDDEDDVHEDKLINSKKSLFDDESENSSFFVEDGKKEETLVKKVSLFDEDDFSLFEDLKSDLFKANNTKKPLSSLFEDDEDTFKSSTSDNLSKIFSEKREEVPSASVKSIKEERIEDSLFGTESSSDQNLFDKNKEISKDSIKQEKREKIEEKRDIKSLFDDEDDDMTGIFKEGIKEEIKQSREEKKVKSLFDEEEDEKNEVLKENTKDQIKQNREEKDDVKSLFDEKDDNKKGILKGDEDEIKQSRGETDMKPLFDDEDYDKKGILKEGVKEDGIRKNEEKKDVKSLFDDGDDIFLDKNSEGTSKIPEVEKKEDIFGFKNIDEDKILEKSSVESSTDDTDDVGISHTNVRDKLNMLLNRNEGVEKDKGIKSSPKKIKHNLNINVRALMPGAALPKPSSVSPLEEKEKNVEQKSLIENVQEQEPSILQNITKSRDRGVKRRPSTRAGRKKFRDSIVDDVWNPEIPPEEEPVLKEPEQKEKVQERDNNKTLKKVEQEMVQPLEEKVASEKLIQRIEENKEEININTSKSSKTEKLQKNNSSKGLFEEDDDDLFSSSSVKIESKPISTSVKDLKESYPEKSFDDLFSPPALDNKPTSNISKLIEDDIFGDDSDDDMFKNLPPIKSKNDSKVVLKTTSSLFDDDEESDDDIFGASSKSIKGIKGEADVLPESSTRSFAEKTMEKLPKSMGLFEDDDEDDDLFGSTSLKTSAPQSKSSSAVKPMKPNLKKLENTEAIDDPLSSLLK